MAPVWSLGRTKYHKIGHRGQNNDKCQYDSPICLNETESSPFVIKITKSVTRRSTPLFQKYGVRSLAKADLRYLSRARTTPSHGPLVRKAKVQLVYLYEIRSPNGPLARI